VATWEGAGYGDDILERYGYQPEFQRALRRFASFAVGFSFISITTGIFSTYGSVLNWGGPRGIWTWPVNVVGQTLVALVFAALAARIPLAGYSYQWASRLTNPKVGWLLGWVSFTFLAVVAVSVDYGLASQVLPSLFNYTGTPSNQWLVTGIVILLQAVLIVFSTRWSTRINSGAVGTEVVGIVGLAVLLVIVGAARGMLRPDHLFSTGVIRSRGYFSVGGLNAAGPFLLSFLLGTYTITGFEAAANLAEETHEAERVVPRMMVYAVLLSGIVGFGFLVALNLASGNIAALSASGTPVADIITETLGAVIGKLFLVLVLFSVFACGLVIFITGTRLTYAMARDGRFPGHALLRQVNPTTGTPLAATVFLGVVLELVLGAFANQSAALTNLFSASSLLPCLIYLSTVILYVVTRHKLPRASGFNLGAFEWPVVILAGLWILFELSIFRDAQFAEPWKYAIAMFAIGLVYFVWMLARAPEALRAVGTPQPPERPDASVHSA